MNDLRRDINEALDRQQAELRDIPATRARMLRAATEPHRRTSQLLPSLAGVAIVLIAAFAVGLTVVLRGLHTNSLSGPHPTPTATAAATATASPAPTPMAQNLSVPAATPVILFHDPADFQQIDGITWDGSATGRIGPPDPSAGNGIRPNGDGSLWATTQDIRDRSGKVVAAIPQPSKGFSGTWADDNRHYCSLTSANPLGVVGGVPTTLQLAAVGQPPRNVTQVGRAYEQTSVGVDACSVRNDLAVVAQADSIGQAVQFWVVRLSTGRVLWTRPSGDIRASRDGRYVAEITYQNGQTPATTIFSSTGAVLGHVSGAVQNFSWDGSLAVVGSYGQRVSVVRWHDGTVVWTGPSNGGFQDASPEPGGSRIAISVSDPRYPQNGGFAPGDLYIVGPDGKATELLTNVVAQF